MNESITVVKILPYDMMPEENGIDALFNDVIGGKERFGFELRDIKMSDIKGFLVVVFIFGRVES